MAGCEIIAVISFPGFQLGTYENPVPGKFAVNESEINRGEGYMRKGDKQKAFFSYGESLRLNPGNDNAKQVMQKLLHSDNP